MATTRKLAPIVVERLRYLLQQGCTTRMICERLGISRTTVYKHSQQIAKPVENAP